MDDMWQKLRDAAIHTGGPWDSQRMWQAVEARARELLAPPIAGMSVEEIEAEMFIAIREKNRRMEGVLYVQECARVAHRLANTPAPEHDPDLELGREILEAANAKLPEGRPGLTYTDDYARAVGRAVAAKKEAGGE